MLFVVSKMFWLAFAPSHLLVWSSALSAILLAAGDVRTGRIVSVATAATFLALGVLPLGLWLVRPLENSFARPTLPTRVDGVLVLGGGLDPEILASRGVSAAECSETRLVSAAELARRFPHARIVFSGGPGPLGATYGAEAEVAQYVFRQLGLDPARVVLERRARTTAENIAFVRQLVRPAKGEIWILATSAVHMRRAMDVANGLGWRMTPWPTDYMTDRSGRADLPGLAVLDVPRNLMLVDYGVHEWLGILAQQIQQG